jgi:hypothetical protein
LDAKQSTKQTPLAFLADALVQIFVSTPSLRKKKIAGIDDDEYFFLT